jgi:hypothetical protein
MSSISKETLEWSYKPFDVVTNEGGDVGFIQEVSLNEGQHYPEHQVQYAVQWMVGEETKHAWFDHKDLTMHCNLFIEIAKSACHPSGSNSRSVQRLFNNFKERQ